MLQYFPKNYIDNYFPKRYFQIKEGQVIVPIPQTQQEISLGGYSPLLNIEREELFKEISLKLPNTKLIPLINKLLVKIENNAEEDETIVLTLINSLLKKQEDENNIIYYVQLIVQLVEIIEKEEEIEKENSDVMNIIEEFNKLNIF